MVGFCARRLGLLDRTSGELGQWGVCRVELESTRLVDWNVNANVVIEIGLQPKGLVNMLPKVQKQVFGNSLVFLEVSAVKLLTLAWEVHPKTAIAADRARALDLEADGVGGVGRCGQVDVWAFA